ncbi:RICIN domain-containing protein [Paenibacillus taiwanensis]|uniref:RICIN domain-containing protein n=1 Tax=Paenibacillus taiwanensis TaxID=401638 RepID=UPI000425616D|nr:RICIN domain-containing protein [Paenibacillus taiwanensis]
MEQGFNPHPHVRNQQSKLVRLRNTAVMIIALCLSLLCNGLIVYAAAPIAPDTIQAGERGPVYIQTGASNKDQVLDIWQGNAVNEQKLQVYNFGGYGNKNQEWTMIVSSDGTFQLKSAKNPALCMDNTWGYDGWKAKWFSVLSVKYCNTTANSQKWYIQRASSSDTTFVIRSVENDSDCMDIKDNNINNGEWPIRYSCASPVATNQSWRIKSYFDSNFYKYLQTLADFRALKMYDDASSRILSVYYNSASSPVTTTSAYKPVSEVTWNGTASNITRTLNWSTVKTNQFTNTNSFEVSATIGTGKDSPVTASITTKYGASWANMHSTSVSDGGSMTFSINPNQGGWILRSQLVSLITGTFTIGTDLGVTYTTPTMTGTIPLSEGVGGQTSVMVACTTDSTNSNCQATNPF